jgi:hypothetical protein
MSTQSSRSHSKFPSLILVLVGILILAGVLYSVLNRNTSLSGKPQLVTNLQQINFGDVKMGEYVQATFQLTNTGTALLKFVEEPYIEVKEGC